MWKLPITNRTSSDVASVITLKALIKSTGWSSTSEVDKSKWLYGEKLELTDYYENNIETSDGMILYLKEDGVIRGCHNNIDLNRIEENTRYLAKLLSENGYTISVVTKNNWLKNELPTDNDYYRILSNIQLIIDNYYVLTNTPMLPSGVSEITYTVANDIEKVLTDIKSLLEGMVAQYQYSGFYGE